MKPDISHKEFKKLQKENGSALGVRVTKEENGKLYILAPCEGGYEWKLPTERQLKNINKHNKSRGGKIYL